MHVIWSRLRHGIIQIIIDRVSVRVCDWLLMTSPTWRYTSTRDSSKWQQTKWRKKTEQLRVRAFLVIPMTTFLVIMNRWRRNQSLMFSLQSSRTNWKNDWTVFSAVPSVWICPAITVFQVRKWRYFVLVPVIKVALQDYYLFNYSINLHRNVNICADFVSFLITICSYSDRIFNFKILRLWQFSVSLALGSSGPGQPGLFHTYDTYTVSDRVASSLLG